VCLDTNVVNLLVKRSDQIFYQIPIPSGLDLTAAEDIEALMHVFTVSARAGWGILASAKTPEEIRKTQNPSTGDNLLDYATDLVPPRTEDSAFATHLGRLLVDAPFTTALTDPPDRELIGNAIGFHCDVFCTCDRETIVNKRERLKQLPIRIMTQAEWWAHIKPWAGLWF
jgi:hypothetical protein